MSEPKVMTDGATISPHTEDASRQPRELDRQIFHLKTLYEASRDLSSTTHPSKILKSFLPIAMGPLGLTFGLGVMLYGETAYAECMGLDSTAKVKYTLTGADLINKFFPNKQDVRLDASPTILVGNHLSREPSLPSGTNIVVALPVNENSFVVLGFGPKISEEPFSDDETNLLQGLAITLSNALKKACAAEQIRTLNEGLQKQNEKMEQALKRMELAQDELNRRAFQLQTLYETTFELSTINDPKAILDAFVLTLMGTFSYSCGWIGLYGPAENQAEAAYRGMIPESLEAIASTEGRTNVLTRFVELKDRMPHSNQSVLLKDTLILAALPADADLAILFSLSYEWRGAIGLSAPLNEAPLSTEMEQLLHSLVGTFMVTLGNAKQIQLIQNLNNDLAAQNIELQATLDELTSAQQEISILTEAKERIISLVNGEVARVWSASWLDTGLIILAGIVLGILFNLTSPSGIKLIPQSLLEPAPTMIEVHEAKQLTAEPVIVIDARPEEFYKQGHIPNAVNLPKDLFNFVYSMKLANIDPATPIIIYGRTISRHYDSDVARELESLGHENIMIIDGGLSAWEDAGYEVTQ